jgi:hypothetical protein
MLKQLWEKLVLMFHPDLHEHNPEKRKTYERLTQAISEARDRGDIGLLEAIAKDPQAFILKQGWASVSLDVAHGLMELRSLYEHLQARIFELIETLDEVRASPDYEIYQFAERDEAALERIAAEQRAELETEIAALHAEAARQAAEAAELVGSVPF